MRWKCFPDSVFCDKSDSLASKVKKGERMAERLRYGKAFPEGIHALLNLGKVIAAGGLEPSLVELVKTRASQLNGCAYCIDMHTRDARAAGETEQRLYALSAWRETPFFTPPRTRRAGVDRSPHQHPAGPCARRNLRAGPQRVR